jgi:ubiquinone biosynthesis protein Coq4
MGWANGLLGRPIKELKKNLNIILPKNKEF